MTVKRNFKRRVRDQQRRTGERYTAARRRILAERAEVVPEETASKAVAAPEETASKTVAAPEETASKTMAAPEETASTEAALGTAPVGAAPDATPIEDALLAALAGPALAVWQTEAELVKAAAGTVPVVELLNVSDDASRLGLRCRVMMFPALAERAEPTNVLTRLRDMLAGTLGDPTTALLCSVALDGQRPPPRRVERDLEPLRQFLRRARAGLGGTTDDGTMLVFHVAGHNGIVPVLCTLSPRDPSLVLTAITGEQSELWDHFAASWLSPVRVVNLQEPVLFLIYDGRRYPVTANPLVIGSGRAISGLMIGDAALPPKHAAVIRRNGKYYLKDLESIYGIHYKGMRIDNKRIDEGDVFHIGAHEIRFTYRPG